MDERGVVTLGVSLKLYLDIPRTLSWAKAVGEMARRHTAVRQGLLRLFVLPSLPALHPTLEALEGSGVLVGAQDLFWEDRGPYTGAVSGADLRQAGCSYVEIGHAERRTLFAEDDGIVRKKLAAALRNELTPILCVGEKRHGSATEAAAATVKQLQSALEEFSLDDTIEDLIVAYEPMWAIGAQRPAPADAVKEVSIALKNALSGDPRVGKASVIYGGSAQPGVLRALGGSVDGLFLGRFAHDPWQFEQVVEETEGLL